jgi:hypothetical protein
MGKTLSVVFAGGAFGALVNSLVVWAFGAYGVSAALKVAMQPALTPGWLYPRIVWGGMWGFLFLLPMLQSSIVGRGILLSLAPTMLQLLYFFPQAGRGYGGLELGALTPLLVLFFNALWGIAAAAWIKLAR